MGRRGRGRTRLKLVANAWVFTVLEGVADSLTLARALGLDPQLFLEAVEGGAMDAPYVQLKGAAMLDDDFEPAFALDGALKDAEPDPGPLPRRSGWNWPCCREHATTSHVPSTTVTGISTWRRPIGRTEPHW